jgi:hypothetical protein
MRMTHSVMGVRAGVQFERVQVGPDGGRRLSPRRETPATPCGASGSHRE